MDEMADEFLNSVGQINSRVILKNIFLPHKQTDSVTDGAFKSKQMIQKKTFRSQCRALYNDRRMQLGSDNGEPCNYSEEDILRLMESTGRVIKGDKVYDSFNAYLKKRAIYDQKYGEWKATQQSNSPKMYRRRAFNKSILGEQKPEFDELVNISVFMTTQKTQEDHRTVPTSHNNSQTTIGADNELKKGKTPA